MSGKPKRKIRNFLLDKRFQLKYTLFMVVISGLISIVLGAFLYDSYKDTHEASQELFNAHKELYGAHRENSQLILLGDLDLGEEISEELQKNDEAQRAKYESIQAKNQAMLETNRNVLISLTVSLGGLVLALAIVGIIATHKIAGPAYAMRRTLSLIADGEFPRVRNLRKGDELQAVAKELKRMADNLRETAEKDVEVLRSAVTALKDSAEVRAAVEGILQKKERGLGEPEA